MPETQAIEVEVVAQVQVQAEGQVGVVEEWRQLLLKAKEVGKVDRRQA